MGFVQSMSGALSAFLGVKLLREVKSAESAKEADFVMGTPYFADRIFVLINAIFSSDSSNLLKS